MRKGLAILASPFVFSLGALTVAPKRRHGRKATAQSAARAAASRSRSRSSSPVINRAPRRYVK